MAIDKRIITGVIKDLVSEGIITESFVPMMVSHSKEIGVNSISKPYVFEMVKEIAKGNLFRNIEKKVNSKPREENFLHTEEFRNLVINEMEKTVLSHRDLMRVFSYTVKVETEGSITRFNIDDIMYLEHYIIQKKLNTISHDYEGKLIYERVMKYIRQNVKYGINRYDYSLIFWEYYYDMVAEFVKDLYNKEITNSEKETLYKSIQTKLVTNVEQMFSNKYIDKNNNIKEFIQLISDSVDEYINKLDGISNTDAVVSEDEFKELKNYEKEILSNLDREELDVILSEVFKNRKAPYVYDYTHINLYIKACIYVDLEYPDAIRKMKDIKSKYSYNDVKFASNVKEIIQNYYLDDLKNLITQLDKLPINNENHVRSIETAEKIGKDENEYNSMILAEHRILNIENVFPKVKLLDHQKRNIQILISSIYKSRVEDGNKGTKTSKNLRYDEVTIQRMKRVEHVIKLPENVNYIKNSGIIKFELGSNLTLNLMLRSVNNKTYTLVISPSYVIIYSGNKQLRGVNSQSTDASDVFSVRNLSSTISNILNVTDLSEGRKELLNRIIMTGYNLQYKNFKLG